ncbi:hypothetical protein LDELB18P2_0843 [Lactobacillus delbrueckii]|nr:hypothetical protein LDELB18P2_0843 [Lactobacillus delbrueckii]
MRGEYPVLRVFKAYKGGSPPLAWGILENRLTMYLKNGITPTCVGNTVYHNVIIFGDVDHPHLRGEYAATDCEDYEKMGSPPLAWGILDLADVLDGAARITPTCVGNTLKPWEIFPNWEDHPHLRGEYCENCGYRFTTFGSPPLAWGILLAFRLVVAALRITPTCVGNTKIEQLQKTHAKDHPHLRGEYRSGNRWTIKGLGSPPLAWGIHAISDVALPGWGITPTCVGNTAWIGLPAGLSSDHPHLRGEYCWCDLP